MGLWGWIQAHGLNLLQTISIIVGLYTSTQALQANTKERKIQNLLALTAAHRELWTRFEQEPNLHRIRETRLDLTKHPVTHQEQRFVHLLILHLRASFKARSAGMQFNDDALKADIRQFFNRPIPSAVWEKSRVFQDRDFVRFVENARASAGEVQAFAID